MKDSSPYVVRVLMTVVGVGILLATWQSLAEGAQNSLRPTPAQAFVAGSEYIRSGLFAQDLVSSLNRVGLGYLSAVALASSLALVCSQLRLVREALAPLLNSFRQVPAIALVPFAVAWLGIGELPKVALVAWAAFFPLWLAMTMALLNPNADVIAAARNMGARGVDLLANVTFPSLLSEILPSFRTSLGLAFVVLIAAEMTGAARGLGYRVSLSTSLLQMDLAVASLALLSVTGVILDKCFLLSVRALFPWFRMRRT